MPIFGLCTNRRSVGWAIAPATWYPRRRNLSVTRVIKTARWTRMIAQFIDVVRDDHRPIENIDVGRYPLSACTSISPVQPVSWLYPSPDDASAAL